MNKHKKLNSMCYMANHYLKGSVYSLSYKQVNFDKYCIKRIQKSVDSYIPEEIIHEGSTDSCTAFLSGVVETLKTFKA